MANLDVVVPDPHPYNCSLVLGSTRLAIPCDYGEGARTTPVVLKRSLRSFFAGFQHMGTTSYGASVDAQAWEALRSHIIRAETPLSQEWLQHGCSLLTKTLTPSGGPSSRPNSPPEPRSAHSSEATGQSAQQIKPGSLIVIKNLVGRSDLNGLRGIVQANRGDGRL